jgi:hypothetical protein
MFRIVFALLFISHANFVLADDHTTEKPRDQVEEVVLTGKVISVPTFGDSYPWVLKVGDKFVELAADKPFWESLKKVGDKDIQVEVRGYETIERAHYSRKLNKVFKVESIKEVARAEAKEADPIIYKEYRLSDFRKAGEAIVNFKRGADQTEVVDFIKRLGLKPLPGIAGASFVTIEIPRDVKAESLRMIAGQTEVKTLIPNFRIGQ